MTVKTIGLIGAGHIGSQLARLAVRHGYDVVVSNSRGPETLDDLVRELGKGARAALPAQLPVYHFQEAPLPRVPPLMVRLMLSP